MTTHKWQDIKNRPGAAPEEAAEADRIRDEIVSETSLTHFRAAAQRVADQHDDIETAGADYRAAKADLLARILEAIRPAARSLGGPVATAMTTTPEGTTTEPAGWRGLYLCGLGPTLVNRVAVPQPETQRAWWPERGRHAGSRLMLRADGKLVELSYGGPWSSVPGETISWKAAATELEPAEAIARGYRMDEILDAIGNALDAQIAGNAGARAEELRSKAERLRSFANLVRGL